MAIPYVHDDGGRSAAGYKGDTSDCVTRAIAIALERPYQDVYDSINLFSKSEHTSKRRRGRSSARTGVYKNTYHRYLISQGMKWVPTMFIGSGCKVHLREDELPKGRIIVSLSRHLAAVIDGVLHDIKDCSRQGTRCVYGYFTKE